MSKIEEINREIMLEVSQPEVQNALLTTTFKGLTLPAMKQAIMEGMMRGFTFKDFLEKNIYAIPYGQGYSLITSIDYSRKIGMRSGIVGISAPKYTYTDGTSQVESCTITVKRKVGKDIGEYSATVFLSEYTTGKNQWATKPRTMIAKVAEMHALRKACPEELAQAYTEEEIEKINIATPEIDIAEYQAQLESASNSEELKKAWSSIPIQAKEKLEELKNKLKAKYENK